MSTLLGIGFTAQKMYFEQNHTARMQEAMFVSNMASCVEFDLGNGSHTYCFWFGISNTGTPILCMWLQAYPNSNPQNSTYFRTEVYQGLSE